MIVRILHWRTTREKHAHIIFVNLVLWQANKYVISRQFFGSSITSSGRDGASLVSSSKAFSRLSSSGRIGSSHSSQAASALPPITPNIIHTANRNHPPRSMAKNSSLSIASALVHTTWPNHGRHGGDMLPAQTLSTPPPLLPSLKSTHDACLPVPWKAEKRRGVSHMNHFATAAFF